MVPQTRTRSGIRRRVSAFTPLSPTTPRCISTKYQLGEELGSGAFGTVFKAVDVHRGTIVALKRIHTANLSPEEVADVEDEVRILRTLEHPNVVQYIESYRDDNHLYVALEYAEGGSLAGLVKPTRCGPLSEDLAALYIEQALKGLDYLHKNQVVHRDVKGANILLTKNGNVKIADFGISRRLQTGDRANTMAGTANFISPEVISGQGASSGSDIWAIGSTLIEILTGKPPYADTREPMAVLFRIMEDRHPPLPQGSQYLRSFLKACFRKDPAKRPSAEELLEYDWIKRARYMRVLRQSASDFSTARMRRVMQQGLAEGSAAVPKTPEQCQELCSSRRNSDSSIAEDDAEYDEGTSDAAPSVTVHRSRSEQINGNTDDDHSQLSTSKTAPECVLSDSYITPEQLKVLREHIEKFLCDKKRMARLQHRRNDGEGLHASFATMTSIRPGLDSSERLDSASAQSGQEDSPDRLKGGEKQREEGQMRSRESRKDHSPGSFHSDGHALCKPRGKSQAPSDSTRSLAKSKNDDSQRSHRPKHSSSQSEGPATMPLEPQSPSRSGTSRREAIAQWRRQLLGKSRP